MDLSKLSRAELQALCKQHGVRANQKNTVLVELLQDKLKDVTSSTPTETSSHKGSKRRKSSVSDAKSTIAEASEEVHPNEAKLEEAENNSNPKKKRGRGKKNPPSAERVESENTSEIQEIPAVKPKRGKGRRTKQHESKNEDIESHVVTASESINAASNKGRKGRSKHIQSSTNGKADSSGKSTDSTRVPNVQEDDSKNTGSRSPTTPSKQAVSENQPRESTPKKRARKSTSIVDSDVVSTPKNRVRSRASRNENSNSVSTAEGEKSMLPSDVSPKRIRKSSFKPDEFVYTQLGPSTPSKPKSTQSPHAIVSDASDSSGAKRKRESIGATATSSEQTHSPKKNSPTKKARKSDSKALQAAVDSPLRESQKEERQANVSEPTQRKRSRLPSQTHETAATATEKIAPVRSRQSRKSSGADTVETTNGSDSTTKKHRKSEDKGSRTLTSFLDSVDIPKKLSKVTKPHPVGRRLPTKNNRKTKNEEEKADIINVSADTSAHKTQKQENELPVTKGKGLKSPSSKTPKSVAKSASSVAVSRPISSSTQSKPAAPEGYEYGPTGKLREKAKIKDFDSIHRKELAKGKDIHEHWLARQGNTNKLVSSAKSKSPSDKPPRATSQVISANLYATKVSEGHAMKKTPKAAVDSNKTPKTVGSGGRRDNRITPKFTSAVSGTSSQPTTGDRPEPKSKRSKSSEKSSSTALVAAPLVPVSKATIQGKPRQIVAHTEKPLGYLPKYLRDKAAGGTSVTTKSLTTKTNPKITRSKPKEDDFIKQKIREQSTKRSKSLQQARKSDTNSK